MIKILITLFICFGPIFASQQKKINPTILRDVKFVNVVVTSRQADGNYWVTSSYKFPGIKYNYKHNGTKRQFWAKIPLAHAKKIAI